MFDIPLLTPNRPHAMRRAFSEKNDFLEKFSSSYVCCGFENDKQSGSRLRGSALFYLRNDISFHLGLRSASDNLAASQPTSRSRRIAASMRQDVNQ